MSLPKFVADLAGTLQSSFRIGAASANSLLKKITGGIAVRNTADSADEAITASQLKNSGDSIILNSDALGTSADWKITVARPASGMTADWTLTLPVDDGSPNQYLQTDGSGNTSWQTVSAGVTNMIQMDDTSLAFGASSPVSMFTTPASSKITEIRIYVDTAFNGTAPTLSIGISGTTSKYGSTGQVDLKTVGVYIWDPGVAAVGGEALIATYAADSSSAGAARIEVDYGVPT